MIQFKDRRGHEFTPTAQSIVKKREGAFVIALHNNKVLLTYQKHAIDVPELPGGGIDEGENALEAAQREFEEETGIALPSGLTADTDFDIHANFYADDVKEFWIYDQTYFLYTKDLASLYFDGRKPAPEQGFKEWISIDKIEALGMHAIHKDILKKVISA